MSTKTFDLNLEVARDVAEILANDVLYSDGVVSSRVVPSEGDTRQVIVTSESTVPLMIVADAILDDGALDVIVSEDGVRASITPSATPSDRIMTYVARDLVVAG